MATVLKLDNAAVNNLLKNQNGPVMRHAIERATRVQERAKQLVGVSESGSPAGSGRHLRDSIVKRFGSDIKGPSVLVGSSLPHAIYHHDDTVRHDIFPKKGKFLVFNVGGQTVFAQKVDHPGTKGTKFLERAAQAEGLRVIRK